MRPPLLADPPPGQFRLIDPSAEPHVLPLFAARLRWLFDTSAGHLAFAAALDALSPHLPPNPTTMPELALAYDVLLKRVILPPAWQAAFPDVSYTTLRSVCAWPRSRVEGALCERQGLFWESLVRAAEKARDADPASAALRVLVPTFWEEARHLRRAR